jgi:Spermine/spermidine synthase domain
MSPTASPAAVSDDQQGGRRRLFALSFLMLFTESALIRWTASNNIHLAYVTNFVLLASFLGIGVGFLRVRRRFDAFAWAPVALAGLVGFVLGFPVTLGLHAGHLVVRSGWVPLPSWVSLSLIFLGSVAVMAGIAQAVARSFATFPPLEAYRLDILGSIAGTVAFAAIAFLRLPPLSWGIVVAGTLLGLYGRRVRWWQALMLVGIVVMLALESLAPRTEWSPYYKLRTATGANHGLAVWANGIPHQTALPLATLHDKQPFYFYAYRHVNRSSLANVLIVGAGTGNDVAVALSRHAEHVDAVEIDPVLQRLGRDHHPSRPYQDPRVSVHINDGRAFLQQTSKHYSLILFALPDSLTLLPGQSNLRLENYLFTIEAMRSARAHLTPRGVFSMYNYYEPFLLDRYASTLKAVYGTSPCVETGEALGGRRQAVLTEAISRSTTRCATYWRGRSVDPVSDDRPFPYLTSRTIPVFYLRALALILLGSLVLVRLFGGSFRSMARYTDLAFMGAAFLLLETKNVVQFALLFGTTWFVNALVFTGVLLSVLMAVEVARHVRLPRPIVLYGALLLALLVAWLVPPGDLLSLSPVPRFLIAVAIAFTPIFLANLIFAQRFRDVGSSTVAFGANLLGAMIGGVLEYLALITGYRFLLVVVAVLYCLAVLSNRRLAFGPTPG